MMRDRSFVLASLLVAAIASAENLDEELRKEVRDGNHAAAESLLENPAVDPDSKDRDGFTALMYAARADRSELVTLLVKAGANLDIQNNGGDTALVVAVKRGRVEAARLLLMSGADIELTDNRGRTALDWAQERNRTYLASIIDMASRPSAARVSLAEQPVTLGSEHLVLPKIVEDTPPLYTESAFNRGVEGRVVLRIIIRKDGSIGPIRIHQRLDDELDGAAVAAVKTWQFEPARVDGEPINVLADVEVDFTIQTKS